MSLRRLVWCAGLATASAGLVEGILLGFLFDPFDAGIAARMLSVATFVALYAVAGLACGLLLGAMVLPVGRWLGASPGTIASVVCGLIGLLYARAWIRTIAADVWLSPVVQISLLIWGFGLFAAIGWMAAAIRRPGRVAAGLGLAILLALPGMVQAVPSRSELLPHSADPSAPFDSRDAFDLPASPRNVLLILADTLRADHLALYGYGRETSPELTRFAREGVTFDNAIVAKTKTSPSVASIFTGTYPYTHGIVTCRTALPDSAVTLAEVLRGKGFATHAIVANSNVGASFGFDQGFDSMDEIWADPSQSDARGVTDHALVWLKSRRESEPARPFFLYVHYIDPHAPYSPPEPYASMFVDDPLAARYAGIRVGLGDDSIGSIRPSVRLPERSTDVGYYVSRYDGEIAYLDHHLGRLFDALKETGLDRHTLVIFTADHGEALSEHDVFFSHGEFGYEDNARVPLVVALPGSLTGGLRLRDPIEVSGIAPTVVASLGLPPSEEMEVRGFWDVLMGLAPPEPAVEPTAFIEAGTTAEALRTSIRTSRWKLIENPTGFDRGPGRWDLRSILSMNRKQKGFELARTGREHLARFELYDLTADPGELHNLAGERREVAAELRARLEAWRARGAGHHRLHETPGSELPEEVIRNLKSLGYIN